MTDALQASLRIAASGLQAQSTRLRVVSENIANAQSTGPAAGDAPYARKTVSFESAIDQPPAFSIWSYTDWAIWVSRPRSLTPLTT